MAHSVVFTRLAEQRLTELYDFIADAASPTIAIGYVRRIRRACLRLAELPERHPRRDDILPGLRVLHFERRVTIAYRVEATSGADCHDRLRRTRFRAGATRA